LSGIILALALFKAGELLVAGSEKLETRPMGLPSVARQEIAVMSRSWAFDAVLFFKRGSRGVLHIKWFGAMYKGR